MITKTLITLAACAAVELAAQAQNLLVNGSFESPGGLSTNTSIALNPGTPQLVGWTVGGTAGQYIAYINGTSPIGGGLFGTPPVDGAYHLAFNPGDTPPGAWIAQTFDTVVGDVYEIAFYVGRQGPSAGTVRLEARVLTSGGEILTNRVATPPAGGYGTIQRFTFIAATTRTTLQFWDTSVDTYGADVLLNAVTVTSRVRITMEVSEVAICWIGSTNHVYQAQYRSDLTTNLWVDLGGPLQGTGGEMCVRDSAFRIPHRFYQVLTLP